MISCDTNILFAACNRDAAGHDTARAFLAGQARTMEFVLCEQVLLELYGLLRNAAVSANPLAPAAAAAIVQQFRSNPFWRIVDVPAGRACMDRVWKAAAAPGFAFRRIFDLRLAETLLHHGVETFATRNVRDFAGCGFKRLFDPLTSQS